MTKTFIEISNEALKKIYQIERRVDGEDVKQSIDLTVQAMLDSGISAAIPRALYLAMEANPQEEISIAVGPFTYGISARKSGDALSFNPTFTLTDEKKFLASLAEFEPDLSKLADKSIIQTMADGIDNELLLDTIIHSCKLEEYDTQKKEWIEKQSDIEKGVELDTKTATIATAAHVTAIVHTLANSKSENELVKYEVAGEGTYTIEYKKGKWEVGFVASKEFKQAIKNDNLLEQMAADAK